MRCACAPPRILRTCWTASTAMAGFYSTRLFSEIPSGARGPYKLAALTVGHPPVLRTWLRARFFSKKISERIAIPHPQKNAGSEFQKKANCLLRSRLRAFIDFHEVFHARNVAIGPIHNIAALKDQRFG